MFLFPHPSLGKLLSAYYSDMMRGTFFATFGVCKSRLNACRHYAQISTVNQCRMIGPRGTWEDKKQDYLCALGVHR
jgi:hypothetical protein